MLQPIFRIARKITRSIIGVYNASKATMVKAFKSHPRTTQHEFPIVDGDGKLRDVLTRDGLVAGLQQRGGQTPVIEPMAANIPVVRDHEKLIKALEPLKKGAAPAVGVVDSKGRLVG
ncbi:hypothetical protein RFM99_19800 [Mesorhizobium sp. VK4C]|uniref:hypothetical protein n=1 Tax=Mesorhizobium captivum TaxID=3072319 RepID=UPI002A24158C|nr:hypothetical protein [Mesorhizobium sp. VK4C]MDX8500652.1 hypothetical protein [Mesorhizobium sp. VK4C]